MISPAVLDVMLSAGASAELIVSVVKAAIADDESAITRRRSADAERQRRHRMSRDITLVTRDKRDSPLSPETKVPPTPPLKTQPLFPKETPSIEGGKKTPKIRTRIIPGWAPSEKDLEYARKSGLLETDIRTETEKFRDHHLKTGSLFLDWNAAWRTWCQRVNEFAVKPRVNGTGNYPISDIRKGF
jgi:hypothetical protein